MENNNIGSLMDVTMNKMREMVDVDTIVGTRGETEELFQEACDFMASLPVAQYHVFPYSERPGTKALEIPHKVHPDDKKSRCQKYTGSEAWY